MRDAIHVGSDDRADEHRHAHAGVAPADAPPDRPRPPAHRAARTRSIAPVVSSAATPTIDSNTPPRRPPHPRPSPTKRTAKRAPPPSSSPRARASAARSPPPRRARRPGRRRHRPPPARRRASAPASRPCRRHPPRTRVERQHRRQSLIAEVDLGAGGACVFAAARCRITMPESSRASTRMCMVLTLNPAFSKTSFADDFALADHRRHHRRRRPADSCRSIVCSGCPRAGHGARPITCPFGAVADETSGPTAPSLQLQPVERITRRVDGHTRPARHAIPPWPAPRARPRPRRIRDPASGCWSINVPGQPLIGPLFVQDQQKSARLQQRTRLIGRQTLQRRDVDRVYRQAGLDDEVHAEVGRGGDA